MLDEFVIRAWVIFEELWDRRNELIFKGIRRNSEESLRIIKTRLIGHITSRRDRLRPKVPSALPCPRWGTPALGRIKLNVDASFSTSGASCGVIARDEVGALLWLWRCRIEADSVAEAELKAVQMALLLARFRNIRRLEIEGDNKIVMDSLAGSKDSPF